MRLLKQYQYLLDAIAADDGSDECLLWPFRTNHHEYGLVWDGTHNRRVHIVAYAVPRKLPLPLAGVVRHTCDNPPCFRRQHLIEGSQRDNIRDAIARGRFKPKGEHHNMAKLNNEQVRQIRSIYAEGGTSFRLLGIQFNVSPSCIQGVLDGSRWQHI